MYVWHVCCGCFADVPLAPGFVVKLSLIIQGEDGLPHHAFTNAHSAVRTVVVMYGRALSRPPTEDEQFGKVVAKDAVSCIRPRLKEAKGAQLVRSRLHAVHPIIHICERRRSVERAQLFDERPERKDSSRSLFTEFWKVDCRSKIC